MRESFPKLFAGKFDTGIYPDEWYWREGMSLPDVTRHMANAWKADLTIAKLALSADIGRAAARLAGWSGARLGQDTIWWKAPKTKPIAHHQDLSFMDFLDPAQTVTCWVTLDDTHRDAGTLEYARGSHLWPLTPLPKSFHGQHDYRTQMKAAAARPASNRPTRFSSKFPPAPVSSMPAKSGTAPARTRPAIVCAAPSASTWCQTTRSSVIGREAISIGAISGPTILLLTKAISRGSGR